MKMGKLEVRAEEFVVAAAENIAEFPVTKVTLTAAVQELVDQHSFDGSELQLLGEAEVWDTVVDARDMITPFYVINLALRKAVMEAAEDYIDQYVANDAMQAADWKTVLDAAEALGLKAQWEPKDYTFLDILAGKFWPFADSVEAYAYAKDDAREALRATVQEKQFPALGIPATEDQAEWIKFSNTLFTCLYALADYVENYAAVSTFRKAEMWAKIVKYHQQQIMPLPENTKFSIIEYRHYLRLQVEAITKYLDY